MPRLEDDERLQDSTGRPRKSRVLGAVRLGIAVALLAFVGWSVPWHDALVLEGESWRGEILGDWKSERVEFRFDPDAALAETSALTGTKAASAVRFGGTVAVSRRGLSSATWSAGPRAVPGDEPEEVAGEVTWRPGMLRAFADLDLLRIAPAFAFLILGILITVVRWWRLLALIGCPTRFFDALRLTGVGLFFSQVVPGQSGGDVVRAILVVREHPERRADALVSVVVDRAVGLVAIIGLATLVVFWRGDSLARLQLPLALVFTGLVLAVLVFANPTVRRFTRFDAILSRLPLGDKLGKLDRAALVYARQPAEMGLAFGLSLANHFVVALAVFSVGHAFGDELSYLDYLCATTVTNTLSSLPLAPGGWGVGEAAFGTLFHLLGSAATLGVATSVAYRLCLVAIGLTCGLFLLLPGGREVSRDLRKMRSAAAEPDAPH